MEPSYIKWKEFSYGERFTDPKFNRLPRKDLKKIKPLTKEYSNYLWCLFISPEYKGWYSVTKDSGLGDDFAFRHIPAIRGKFNKEKKDRTRMILKYLVDNPKWMSVIVFWHKDIAVETTWGIFLKYWQDFCTRLDFEIIAILAAREAVHYIEEVNKFSVVDREREFGKTNFDLVED